MPSAENNQGAEVGDYYYTCQHDTVRTNAAHGPMSQTAVSHAPLRCVSVRFIGQDYSTEYCVGLLALIRFLDYSPVTNQLLPMSTLFKKPEPVSPVTLRVKQIPIWQGIHHFIWVGSVTFGDLYMMMAGYGSGQSKRLLLIPCMTFGKKPGFAAVFVPKGHYNRGGGVADSVSRPNGLASTSFFGLTPVGVGESSFKFHAEMIDGNQSSACPVAHHEARNAHDRHAISHLGPHLPSRVNLSLRKDAVYEWPVDFDAHSVFLTSSVVPSF
jgi:hypothetical protein